jgi:hypothetical protein
MGLSKTIWMAEGDLDVLSQRSAMTYHEQIDFFGSFMDSISIAEEKSKIEYDVWFEKARRGLN